MIRIDYGSLLLNSGIPDEDGALWYATSMKGWSGPSLRQSASVPTMKHGTILNESMLGSRGIDIDGVCKATGEAGFWAAYNRLTALGHVITAPTRLLVHETVPKYVMVVAADAPDIKFGYGSSFQFSLSLEAHDPLKYAEEVISRTIGAGATVSIDHQGTFSTNPEIVTGGDVRLTNLTTGGTLSTITGSPVPNGTLFDFVRRTVATSNVSHYGKLSPGSVWWPLAPGVNQIRNQGSQSATIYYRNTYV